MSYAGLTTVCAVSVLMLCTVRVFGRVGEILAISTAFALLYALVVFPAALVVAGPLRTTPSWRRTAKYCGAVALLALVSVLALYVAHLCGVDVLGPNGRPLFEAGAGGSSTSRTMPPGRD